MGEYDRGSRVRGNDGRGNSDRGTAYSDRGRSPAVEHAELEREKYQDYLERKQYREIRRRKQEERRRRKRKRIVKLILKMILLLLLFVAFFVLIYKVFLSNPVEKTVTVEAGIDNLDAKEFLKENKRDKVEIQYVTDMSEIDFRHVGEHEIVLKAKGKERESVLVIEDTVAPTGEGKTMMVSTKAELEAEDFVTDVVDATDVTFHFKDTPDFSREGTMTVTVVLTDEGGNQTEVVSEVTAVTDEEMPVIDGVAPLTAFIGDPISYKGAITVTDNCDEDVELEVDNSEVDTETPGVYNITYQATDFAGNMAEKSTTITIKEKPEDYVDPETVYEEADAVLAEITTNDMTLKQKAKAIYTWARTNIAYVNSSEKESWTNGAHQGFTKKSGDCFIYFATTKALLTEAGIPNIDVVKSDTSHSSHYWSLVDVGDGWYHFDATPRQAGGEFFLLTDDEILAYSEAHRNSHIFDRSLYPATPTTDSTID